MIVPRAEDRRLRRALDRLEQLFDEQQAPIARQLRPGLDAATLAELTAGLTPGLPAEVRIWFSWHDGAEVRGWESTLPNGLLLLSLQEALEEHAAVLAEPGTESYYSPLWLPLCGRGGYFIAIDRAVAGGEVTPVRYVGPEETDAFVVKAASLTEMIETWVRMCEEGYWRYDHTNGQWEDHLAEIPLQLRITRLV